MSKFSHDIIVECDCSISYIYHRVCAFIANMIKCFDRTLKGIP